MDKNGNLEHALTAVLYAVKKANYDLELILENVKTGIISNSIRPLPQDQEDVIETVKKAIKDVKETS